MDIDVEDELGITGIAIGADEIAGIEDTGEVVAAIGLTDNVGVLIRFDLGLNKF